MIIQTNEITKISIAIIGGCGHVGLPLGIAFAEANFNVKLIDINQKNIDIVNSGTMPFVENANAEQILQQNIANGHISATNNFDCIRKCDVVVFVTGTPVDEHLNPRINDVVHVVKQYINFLNKKQLIILRSTLYPGVVKLVDDILTGYLGEHNLAFCPERIVQGYGFEEIKKLPQIISATSLKAENLAIDLFKKITPTIIKLTPEEAELAKLITNSWRYIEFAIANQFYMMTEARGLDFYKIYDALKYKYDRADHFASPGLSAGPCLFKDTMQLSAFHEGNFFLGHAAMLINEGLPVFIVKQLENKIGCLAKKKILILGMAFKANNDDKRESLSYKIKKLLQIKMANVLESDIYDKNTQNYTEAINDSDGIILGTPHKQYLDIKITKPYIDCWGIWRERVVNYYNNGE